MGRCDGYSSYHTGCYECHETLCGHDWCALGYNTRSSYNGEYYCCNCKRKAMKRNEKVDSVIESVKDILEMDYVDKDVINDVVKEIKKLRQ